MNQTTLTDVVMWLLLIAATTFSILSIVISYRLLKKFDEFQFSIVELLDLLSTERVKMIKDLEELKRRVRMFGNEVKKENRRSTED
jgi:hypothetical protein